MPLTTLYNTGTVSVGAGSTTVTGSGTAWNTAGLQAGDDFRASGLTVPIASINSATSITLSRAWPGSALSGANYDIRRIPDEVRYLEASNQLLQKLAGGTLTSLGSIAGAANFMPYWTGAGVMGSTALTPLGRTLMGSADAPSMRTTLGLVLTTSAVDTAAGRVTKVGDFGWGQIGTVPEIPDFQGTNTATGLYYYATASTPNAAANIPAGAVSQGTILVERAFSSGVTQTLTEFSLDASKDGRKWRRSYSSTRGAWTPWVLQITQALILGTVSQSGGVPTGAIIERGSNANGEYVRFADGTQICWGMIAPDFTNSVNQTFSYPAAFVSSPSGGVVGVRSGTPTAIANFLTAKASGGSGTTLFFLSLSGAGTNGTGAEYQLSFHFIGRWF